MMKMANLEDFLKIAERIFHMMGSYGGKISNNSRTNSDKHIVIIIHLVICGFSNATINFDLQ